MDDKKGIFQNKFLLGLKDDSIEQEFNHIRIKKIIKFNPWIVAFTLLVSLGDIIYQITNMKNIVENKFSWIYVNLYTAIIIASICFFNLFLVLLTKRSMIQKYIGFSSYLLLTLPWFHIRKIMMLLNQFDSRGNTFAIINVAEFFMRLMFFLSRIILFAEGLILNFLCSITLMIYDPIVSKKASFEEFNLIFTFLMIFMSVIVYFFNMEIKKNFYVNLQLKRNNKWHISVMNNMISGFICIKDKKIDFLNSSIINKIKINKEIRKIIEKNEIVINTITNTREQNILIDNSRYKIEKTNEEIHDIIRDDEKKCVKILDVILSDMNCDINREKHSIMKDLHTVKNEQESDVIVHPRLPSESNSITLNKSQFSSIDFLKQFQSTYMNKNFNGNFTLVGYKDLLVERESNGEIITEIINLEVNGRFYKIREGSKNEIYEFIFKDITRAKHIEEKNAEFKYKTLFLSKVAHEFKNPLICILELLNQIYDDLDGNKLEKENDNLNSHKHNKDTEIKKSLFNSLSMIKALSNFMLLLVKDLDFFSQIQIGSTQILDMNEANLKEILEFCLEISNGLLLKNNKDSHVSIVIKQSDKLPKKILTDDIKLKQILINLISNAIKFTENGKIIISLTTLSEGMLRFEIEDTGSGMTEEQKKNLFKPFYKVNSQNNKLGAGLGLTIISDLIHKLGSSISYDSKLGQGTKFWFDLPYTVPNEKLSEINLKRDNFGNSLNIVNKKKSLFHEFRKPSESDYIGSHNEIVHNSSKISITNSIRSQNSQETVKQTMKLTHPWMRRNNISNQLINKNSDKINYHIQNQIIFQYNKSETINSINSKENFSLKKYFEESNDSSYNFIVADDEKYARKSVIRVLSNVANKIGKKINLIESEDGIETLYIICQSLIKGVSISGIISDENMKFMTGSKSAHLLKSFENAAIKKIPFFLITAYDSLNAIERASSVDFVYQKPFNLQSAEKIFKTEI